MRLLIVALMLAFAMPASAKTLIVAEQAYAPNLFGAEYNVPCNAEIWSRAKALADVLGETGSSYVVIAPGLMKTEFARTGVVTWNFGTSAAYNETFDAVVHASFARKSTASQRYNSGYRPDSLSLSWNATTGEAMKLLVPQLFLMGTDCSAIAGLTATTCSLGIVAGYTAASGNVPDHDDEASYFDPNGVERWSGTSNQGYDSLSLTQLSGKGWRRLLAKGNGAMGQQWQVTQVYPKDADSTVRANAPGSALVWMIQKSHIDGSKPIIIANVSDGLGVDVAGHEWIDRTPLWVAMAALDSAAGGLVFDNESKLPLGVAITVDGLCSRSSATNSGGIVPADSTQFYGTIDSLRTWGIRATFGTNLDSVASYPRDLQYVKDNMPLARFSPQSRAGLDTAVAFAPAALGGNNRRNRAVDTFGRYRNQAMAYGSSAGAAKDTSLYARLKYALALGDSIWGFGRTSRFALPPDDDWSPYNMRGNQMDAAKGVTVDSVLFAYAKAGFRGIRINGSWVVGNPNKTPTNPRGYVQEQGRYETADRGLRINLIAHGGSSTWGNRPLNWSSQNDSVLPMGSDPSPTVQWYSTARFWFGITGVQSDLINDPTTGNITANENDENSTGAPCKSRILKLSCQELAGPATGSVTKDSATRPGWWAIRRVVMPVRLINRLAGRTIISVGYPEDIVLR